jgi:uncharacterized protein YkwD
MAATVRQALAVAVIMMGLATATGNLWITEHAELDHQIHAMRSFYGLAPIPEDAELTDLATEHSWRMARAQQIFHSTEVQMAGSPEPWETIGQTVGKGSRVWLVVRAFMDSPTHRDLILGDWTAVGYGHIRAADGNVYVTLWFRK